jgi:hypothetical protein
VEYLKNTVLQLFTSGADPEALLPVFAAVLSLSPGEVTKCREGIQRFKAGEEPPLPGAAGLVDSAADLLSGWGSWLGGGPSTTPSSQGKG